MKKRLLAILLVIALLCPMLIIPSFAETTVYKTKTGECYHCANCSCLSKSCIPISLSEANAEGLRPCSKCHAPAATKSSAPAAPKSVKATNVASSGKIKISWGEVNKADKYYVYRASSKSGDYSKIGSTTSTSYTDKTAKVGKTYYYKVKAVAADGTKSAYSAIVSLTCDCARPDVSIKLSSGHPKLSWDMVTGAEKYYVYRATSKSGDYSKIGSTTSTSYTDKKAKAGKTYYYKVKAINSNSSANSAYSSVDSIKAK